MAERFPYGGQAVMEGVMMRGLHRASVAVRSPSGQIVIRDRELNLARRVFWSRLPLLRGIQLLGDALVIGMWALMFSASVTDDQAEQPLSKGQTALLVATSVGISIALFFVLPLLVASGIASWAKLGIYSRETIEGITRLLIFVGYLILVGRTAEIRRVFGYHGAEHKAVSAYEAGLPLTVEHVRPFTTIHPRCGTTLLLIVVVLSIPVFALLGTFPFWLRLLSRIILVPFVAALAYELMRLTASKATNPIVRGLMTPALALQRLTTREPDDAMLEVAIAALARVLAADGQTIETQPIAVDIRPALTS
ncbi:DUF1385 domain-containing protein [Herpetosiphon llansteffanensis]|uniref:DUF1385 domain-containing protein n=1 Tax=Herpetosiphon llansteffanensis TaxID=2094568 RepID=UPI000D7C7421|nr:DUF1385 domain-containing protein [Herpetosiphon llansteffanensis]